MIKRTLYFGKPAYLGMRNFQLEVRSPYAENKFAIADGEHPKSYRRNTLIFLTYFCPLNSKKK